MQQSTARARTAARWYLEGVLNGRLEVERLNEGSFVQDLGVPDTPHFDSIRVAANTKLWVLPYSTLDDLGDMLQRRAILLDTVVAQGNVVCQVWPVAESIRRVHEFGSG